MSHNWTWLGEMRALIERIFNSDPNEAKAVSVFANLQKIRIRAAFGEFENNNV